MKDNLRASVLTYSLWILHRENLHGVLQYKAPHLKFLHVFWLGNYQKMDWREPEMIVKVGKWSRYISRVQASNNIVSFGNEAWSEDLILFDSTRVRLKPLRPICDHYWVFLPVIATFEILHKQKFAVERYAHTQFRS